MNVLNNFEVPDSAMYDGWLNVQWRYMHNPSLHWFNSLSQNNLKTNANANVTCIILSNNANANVLFFINYLMLMFNANDNALLC